MRHLVFFLYCLLISICCFAQSRYISSDTKKIVFARDGGMCRCCGSSQNLEYDHIIPYSCGGKSDRSNIQLLCMKCNRSKSNGCYCNIHGKKVGIDCCDGKKSKIGITEVNRSTSAQQCTGTTKKGARCRNRTTHSSGRCHLHD